MNRRKLKFALLAILLSSIFLIFSPKEKILPKPTAFLRVDIPEPEYEAVNLPQLSFKRNKIAYYDVETQKIIYPNQNAAIHMTYNSLKKKNLEKLLTDMEKLTFNHTIKADEIDAITYTDPMKKKFGRRYDVSGNAASPVQFYVTDSITHFLNGSLYFNMQPNYDVHYPLIVYMRKDIDVLIKSLKWK